MFCINVINVILLESYKAKSEGNEGQVSISTYP